MDLNNDKNTFYILLLLYRLTHQVAVLNGPQCATVHQLYCRSHPEYTQWLHQLHTYLPINANVVKYTQNLFMPLFIA